MLTRSRWVRGPVLAALVVGLATGPDADARGFKGSRPAQAHAPKPSHASGARPAAMTPRMPRASAPTHANAARVQARNTLSTNAATSTRRPGSTGTGRTATSAALLAGTTPMNAYTYGSGTHARSYRARGYGSGYRNRLAGQGSGYGRSQANNRAVVGRLRSVHSNLARLDHDYHGHRISAMHHVSMAIRQLTHRSMVYRGTGFTGATNNGSAQALRPRTNVARNGQRPGMTQAQSDSRMSQSLRTLQGVHMQLARQSSSLGSEARASGHVERSVHELNTALTIR